VANIGTDANTLPNRVLPWELAFRKRFAEQDGLKRAGHVVLIE
jgi:hypothetical protein